MNSDNFNNLLAWLDPDRDGAARKYEELRRMLIFFYENNDCYDAPTWADETIERVAKKIAGEKIAPMANPNPYFKGFARYILKECLRQQGKHSQQTQSIEDDVLDPDSEAAPNQTEKGGHLICLQQCLRSFPREQYQQLLRYYEHRGRKKIRARKKLAKALGVSIESLRVKLFHLKKKLEACVQKCLEQKRRANR